MFNISCDICMDLIPLIKDDVASQDSRNAVLEHIESCEQCKSLYKADINEKQQINDQKVINKIKKQLGIIVLVFIVLGTLLGAGISNSNLLFYNVLLMPCIGILSYITLSYKSVIIPVCIFLFVYIWNFVLYLFDGSFVDETISALLVAPVFFALIYAILCLLGIVATFLLHYAFGKKEKHYEK